MIRGTRALALFWLAIGLSCSGRIAFRERMDDVQRKYVILFDELERGVNLEARDAARSLRLALSEPALADSSSHAADEEFRRLLLEARDAAGRIEVEAEHFDQERLTRLRGDVSRSCRGCHERFRAAD